ncbi:hypothetical protein [Actinoplanes sp. NPDC026619]|uniref:hypothetical protein n=1 Tax=Actinoplanes sp. NPDC026619 TaxID=3155798 RepID=UPI0033D79A38
MKIRHRAIVVAAVAGIAITGAAPAMAATASVTSPKPSAGASGGSTSGTTASFSAQGTLAALNGLKLSLAGDNGTTAVTVDPKAAVTLDGNTAKLLSLPIGAQVKLSGGTTGGVSVATRVDATSVRPFIAAGSVAGVDLEDRTISVTPLLAGEQATPKTYPVATDAKITLDGKAVALSALPVRAHLVVLGNVTSGTYSAKSLTAVSRWQLNLSGTVSALDAAKGTVTVNSKGAAVKLNVNPNATIQVNGAKVTLANLPIGATVNLTGIESTTGAQVAGITAKISPAKAFPARTLGRERFGVSGGCGTGPGPDRRPPGRPRSCPCRPSQ